MECVHTQNNVIIPLFTRHLTLSSFIHLNFFNAITLPLLFIFSPSDAAEIIRWKRIEMEGKEAVSVMCVIIFVDTSFRPRIRAVEKRRKEKGREKISGSLYGRVKIFPFSRYIPRYLVHLRRKGSPQR